MSNTYGVNWESLLCTSLLNRGVAGGMPSSCVRCGLVVEKKFVKEVCPLFSFRMCFVNGFMKLLASAFAYSHSGVIL